ncbi:MAG: hypothetical protein ACRD0K_12120 [Egibacteraceae bacterium]
MEIMEALIDQRLHRCVPLPDVMVASLAVVQRLSVVHHDRDFDRIKQVYGAPDAEWLRL